MRKTTNGIFRVVLFFVVSASHLAAQTYYEFPDSDAIWRETYFEFDGCNGPGGNSGIYFNEHTLYLGNAVNYLLNNYIEVLEQCLGRKAEKNLLPLQIGDVPDTWADAEDLVRDVGYRPATPVEEGVRRFVDWYLGYYKDGGPPDPQVTNLG